MSRLACTPWLRHVWAGLIMLTGLPATGVVSVHEVQSAPLQQVPGEGLQRLSVPLQALQASRHPDWEDVWIVDAQGRPLPQAWAGEPPAPPLQAHWVTLPLFAWPSGLPLRPRGGASLRMQLDASGAVVHVESTHDADRLATARTGTRAPPLVDRPLAAESAAGQVWLLDLHGLQTPPSQLRLNWPRQPGGWRARVQVQASQDAHDWVPVGSGTLLEAPAQAQAETVGPRATAGAPLLQQQVELGRMGARLPRYLRIELDRPLPLAGVEALQMQARPDPALPRLTLPTTPQVGVDGDRPAWLLDLGGAVPVRRLQVQLREANRVLPLDLAWAVPGEPGELHWRFETRYTAYRLQRLGQLDVSPAVSVQAPAARYWRLQLAAGTRDATAAAPDVELAWQPPQLVFVAEGPPPYRLRVGPWPRGIDPAQGPAAAVRRSLWSLIPDYAAGSEHQLPAAALTTGFTGEPLPRMDWLDQLRNSPQQIRQRWLLWAVLIVAMLALALMARRLLRDLAAARAADPPR